jgi:predicted amidohydrolase
VSDPFKVACIQINSGSDVAANLAAAVDLVRQARSAGADLIALPETVNCMAPDRAFLKDNIQPEEGNQALQTFADLARETGAWVLIGSILVGAPYSGKMANRSLLLDGDGVVRARYDKIHMFDANLGSAETHRESHHYNAGDEAVLVETPWAGRCSNYRCAFCLYPYQWRSSLVCLT